MSVIAECLANYSIEVTPGAARKITSFADIELLPPGTVVNVTYLVGADMEESLAICSRLVEGGMKPVAHVPARAFATMEDAEAYLSQLSELGETQHEACAARTGGAVGAWSEPAHQ